MPISKDLLLAILSMDSYNRGYGAGISDSGQNDPDGLGEASNGTVLVGTTTVSTILGDVSQTFNAEAQAAGFYAISYTISDGSKVDGLDTGDTVISYRGTDAASDLWDSFELAELGELILTDIPIALNDDFDEPSIHLASQFYQSVLASSGDSTISTR